MEPKLTKRNKWLDAFVAAMIVVSLAGLIYVFLQW